jgi:hypothetical protein
MTQDISPRFGCLLATYVLVVVSPHLMVHMLIDFTHQTCDLGAAKTTQKGALQLATILLELLFTISREDDHKSPLKIT